MTSCNRFRNVFEVFASLLEFAKLWQTLTSLGKPWQKTASLLELADFGKPWQTMADYGKL